MYLVPPSVPTMQFLTTKVTVQEKLGVVHVPVIRTGDLSYESSVRCFTRQKTAQVMMDYDERLNTDDFRIVFAPGEKVMILQKLGCCWHVSH